MAVTTNSNVIRPQVMADMIEAKINAQLKLTPYARVNNKLVGVPGDTVTVPSWNYIGDAIAVAENNQIPMDQMSASTATFTIGKASKGVTITTEAINNGMGNPIGQAETQLAKAIAGKVDSDVLAAAYTGTVVVAPETLAKIAYAGLVDAITKFGDEEDGVEKVVFIHPDQEATLLKDSDFLSADKFTSGVAVNGAIGKIAGAWVKKSRKVAKIGYTLEEGSGTGIVKIVASGASTGEINLAAVTTGIWDAENRKLVAPAVDMYIKAVTHAYFLNPIIKLEPDSDDTEYSEDELPALTIFLKKDTVVSTDYDIEYDRHMITANKYYGVAKTNDAKIVLAQFKA